MFGYDTEQAFKKRRVTFSEHEQRETHEAQVQRSRMKFVLAEGKLPPAETGKIFGFVTLIDPYTDTELKRWIRLERKISPLIRTPMILSSRKERRASFSFGYHIPSIYAVNQNEMLHKAKTVQCVFSP